MSIIQNIQKKSPKQKMVLMWTITGVIAIVLIGLWILSAHFQRKTATDTSLFDTIGSGLHNFKENYKK